MRPAKLHELRLPTKYALWRKYIYDTELATQIGVERFIQLLTSKQAIELVQTKGLIKCKTLSEQKIQETIKELYSKPFQSFFAVYFSKAAKLLKRTKPKQTHTTQSK